jgi:hypothetical protein
MLIWRKYTTAKDLDCIIGPKKVEFWGETLIIRYLPRLDGPYTMPTDFVKKINIVHPYVGVRLKVYINTGKTVLLYADVYELEFSGNKVILHSFSDDFKHKLPVAYNVNNVMRVEQVTESNLTTAQMLIVVAKEAMGRSGAAEDTCGDELNTTMVQEFSLQPIDPTRRPSDSDIQHYTDRMRSAGYYISERHAEFYAEFKCPHCYERVTEKIKLGYKQGTNTVIAHLPIRCSLCKQFEDEGGTL